jgi:hypothetical protein
MAPRARRPCDGEAAAGEGRRRGELGRAFVFDFFFFLLWPGSLEGGRKVREVRGKRKEARVCLGGREDGVVKETKRGRPLLPGAGSGSNRPREDFYNRFNRLVFFHLREPVVKGLKTRSQGSFYILFETFYSLRFKIYDVLGL